MNKRYGLPATEAACVLLFTSLLLTDSGIFAMNRSQQKTTVESVRGFSDIALEVNSSENAVVSIQSATTKTITKSQYRDLTGVLAASARYTACPAVRVINMADQTVKAFSLGLLNKRTNTLDVLRIGSHPLEPREEFVIEPLLWAKARKKPTTNFILRDGLAWEDKSAPDWNSEEMWFPGNAADFQIFVGEVEFSDGTSWFIKR